MLSAFDKECPRCVQLKGRKPAADRVEAEAPVAAAPIAAPRQVVTKPVALGAPTALPSQEQAYAPQIDGRMLHCAVCGAAETQRLTAILNSDSWTVISNRRRDRRSRPYLHDGWPDRIQFRRPHDAR